MDLGERIRYVRKFRKMTQLELAEKCGLCRQNISTILTRKTCEPKTIGKISKGLNVSIDEIIEKE